MQRNSFFRFSFFIALNILAVPLFGQDQTDQNWWFGNTTNGIQFSQPGDTARLVSRTGSFGTFGLNGSAVASHPVTGGLMFYTDGSTIYDATHQSMPNGGGLTGNPGGAQPAVICRVPGQTDRYYVITNSAVTGTPGTLASTIVDMTLPGRNVPPFNNNLFAPPLGDVDAAAKSIPIAGLTSEAEPMVIIKNSNGVDYWLITQVINSNTFNITSITATGFSTTPVTFNTSPGFIVPFTASQFAYNEPLGKLAIAPADMNKNVVILDFDDATGALTFDQYLNNSAVTTNLTEPVVYDVEWSDNTGAYLYVSRQGDTGTNGSLLQYDMQITNATPSPVNVNGIVRSYGLQLGPDSLVYHLYQTTVGGPIFAGRIDDPDTVASQVNFQDSLFNGAQFTAKQFPSFLVAQPIVIIPEFTSVGTCSNSPVNFFPTIEPGADSVRWSFGEAPPTFSTSWAPIHTYTAGGTFTVRLTAYLSGDSAFVEHDVTITDFQLQLTLVADTIACSCELRFPKNDPDPSDNNADRYENGAGSVCPEFSLTATASGSPSNINWFGPSGNLGLGTLTLTPVDSAGFYYVTAEDASAPGCVAYAGVNIQEYGVIDQRANFWHFGNNAGIDFNIYTPTDSPDPIEGPVVSAEGVATISDRNGQVIFSTNGEQVWDKNGVALLSGTNTLGGNQDATQSSFIIPFPNDPTLYYIFTTQKVYPDPGVNEYELRYAIFDLKIGDGNLVDIDNNPGNGLTPSAVLFTKSTERITGNAGWLIAHEYGNNNFRAYPITAQGIGAPVISSIGSDHSLQYPENAQGYMKQTGGNIVVALSSPGVSNVVELFDFNNGSGAVTNFRQIDLMQPSGQVYGVEISGNRLFATTRPTLAEPNSMLHEFVLDTISNTFERVGTIPVVTATGALGAIERGPDGQTYVAINGSGSLGTITVAGDFVTPSTLNENGFALSPTVPPGGTPTSTFGLPNFIQSIGAPAMAPSIAFTSQCVDTPIDFTGSGTSIIDTLIWDFGDGQRMRGVNLTTVQHTYTAPGNYTVSITPKNRCAGPLQSIDTVITIYPNPTPLGGALAICDGTEVMTATGTPQPGESYFWTTGDTTLTVIPPAGSAFHSVTIISAQGCTADGTWLVTDIRPQVELGPDQTLCQSSGGPQYDFTGEGDSFNWTRNNSAFSTNAAVTIPTATAGVFEYKLTVDNSLTGCTITDSVTFTINERPQYTTTVIQDPTPCGNSNGEIEIQITTNKNYTYSVTGPTVVSPGSTAGPATIPVTNLLAGAYNVNVTDQVSGCANQRTVGLSDATFTADIARAQACNDPVTDRMPVTITTTPGQTNFIYTIYSGTTTNVIVTGDETFTPTPTVPNGSYVVEVKSPPTGAVCTAVSPVTNIRQDPEVPIDNVIPNVCTPPFTLQAVTSTASPTFSWTPLTQIVSGANTSTITINSSTSPQTFKVEVTGLAGTCPHDTTVTVNVGSDPQANITQSSACTDQVILTATPSGNYDYRWENLDDPSTPAFFAGPQIAVDTLQNGNTYRVEVINQFTGCTGNTFDYDVAVLGVLTVDLDVPVQICEGAPYTLTAETGQPTATFVWELDGQVLVNENASTLTISDNRDGLFTVTASVSSGSETCQDDAQATVVVAPTTPGLLPDTGIICPDAPDSSPQSHRLLNPGDGFISYEWFKEPSATVLATTPTFDATETGTFRVALLNRFNCPSEDEIILTEECDPRISGPNAFRPGGLNKEFSIFYDFIDETAFEIYIFNRWGEMVFYEDTPEFKWNGGYKNDISQPLPQGTYSYLIKYKSEYRPQLGTLEYRGGVVLLR
jgi:large repetitive protein